MGLKQKILKLYANISPQYRKILYLEQKINALQKNINIYQSRNQNMLWLLLGENEHSNTIKSAQRTFWLNYPKADGDMQIIQNANLYLMIHLSEICDYLGIQFWMHGGSLIGAVRHQGFIPWDDDVDVGMLRYDLNKLIEHLKDDEVYQISIAYHNDEKFSKGYQFKLRDERFCCFIDIFIFDYYSGNPETFADRFSNVRKRMVCEYLNCIQEVDPDYLAWHFVRYNEEKYPTVKEILDKYLGEMGNNRSSEHIYYSIENYPFNYPLLEQEDIFPLNKVEFSGITVNIPNNPDKYLQGYGDYWQLPADVGRAAHFYYYKPHIEYLKAAINGRNVDE